MCDRSPAHRSMYLGFFGAVEGGASAANYSAGQETLFAIITARSSWHWTSDWAFASDAVVTVSLPSSAPGANDLDPAWPEGAQGGVGAGARAQQFEVQAGGSLGLTPGRCPRHGAASRRLSRQSAPSPVGVRLPHQFRGVPVLLHHQCKVSSPLQITGQMLEQFPVASSWPL